MLGMLRGLWLYRNFVLSSIHNEFVSRFVRSKIGGVWAIIHPLAQVVMYALVLSNLLAAKIPQINSGYAYALYLMAGMLSWNLFVEIVTRCLTLFIDKSNLIKKIKFPRITLPVIVVGSSLFNGGLLFVSILFVFFLMGHVANLNALYIIPILLITAVFATGVGLFLGIINVFVRDVGQVTPIILQFLFFGTPIIYPISIIPENIAYYLHFNPMYYIVEACHQVLLYGETPNFLHIGAVLLFSIMFAIFSLVLFRKASSDIVDAL